MHSFDRSVPDQYQQQRPMYPPPDHGNAYWGQREQKSNYPPQRQPPPSHTVYQTGQWEDDEDGQSTVVEACALFSGGPTRQTERVPFMSREPTNNHVMSSMPQRSRPPQRAFMEPEPRSMHRSLERRQALNFSQEQPPQMRRQNIDFYDGLADRPAYRPPNPSQGRSIQQTVDVASGRYRDMPNPSQRLPPLLDVMPGYHQQPPNQQRQAPVGVYGGYVKQSMDNEFDQEKFELLEKIRLLEEENRKIKSEFHDLSRRVDSVMPSQQNRQQHLRFADPIDDSRFGGSDRFGGDSRSGGSDRFGGDSRSGGSDRFGGDSRSRGNDRGGSATDRPLRDRSAGGMKTGACFGCGEAGHNRNECPKGSGGGLKGSCYGCGEVGHNRSDCPKNSGSRGGSMKTGTCFGCGEAGHNRSECPKNKDFGQRGGASSGGYMTQNKSSASKGMVDDEFAEEDESDLAFAPVSAKPIQNSQIMMEDDKPEQQIVPQTKTEKFESNSTPTPVVTVEQPEVVVGESKSKETPSVSEPPKRFTRPTIPKIRTAVPSPPKTENVLAKSLSADMSKEECIACGKRLTMVVKQCSDCSKPLCSSYDCLESHNETCQSNESVLLTPELQRKSEAEREPDAWKPALDEIQKACHSKLPLKSPRMVKVLNFKNPGDFWVAETSHEKDQELFKFDLPSKAADAQVFGEASLKLKPGILAYSLQKLRPLTSNATLVVEPGQNTVQNTCENFDDFIRCLVLSINFNTQIAQVLALDGGFESEIPVSMLRQCDDNFKAIRVRAIHCSFEPFLMAPSHNNNKWPSVHDFEPLSDLSKPFIAIFDDFVDGKTSCQLVSPGSWDFITDKLLSNQLAQSNSIFDACNVPCIGTAFHFSTPYEWLESPIFKARVNSYRSLDDFSIIVHEPLDIKLLQQRMAHHYGNINEKPLDGVVEPGQLVVVGNNNQWDRGIWKSGKVGSQNCEVELVDCGRILQDTCNCLVFPLKMQFLAMPTLGVSHCRLTEGIINSIDHQHNDELVHLNFMRIAEKIVEFNLLFVEKIENQENRMVLGFTDSQNESKLKEAVKNQLVLVPESEPYINNNDLLLAVIDEILPGDSKNGVEALIQPLGEEYLKTSEELGKIVASNRRRVPRPAKFQCCLLETDDGCYRVRILERCDVKLGTVKVEFLDTAEIKQVPIANLLEATKNEAQLRRLMLRGLIEFSSKYDERESIRQGNVFNFRCNFVNSQWKLQVERFMNNSVDAPTLSSDEDNEGVVTNVESPDSFYILLDSNEDLEAKVNEYGEEAPEVYENGSGFIENEYCIAKFDGAWYRAMILHAGSNPEVVFVDYGNKMKVTDAATEMRPFSESFCKHPRFGILCGLAEIVPAHPKSMTGLGNEWPSDATEFFNDLVFEKVVRFRSFSRGKIRAVLPDEDNLDIADELVNKGFALRV